MSRTTPFNGSSPNVELPCNKINGLCVVTVLVATNACQQNQIVTDSEVKMGFKEVERRSAESTSRNIRSIYRYLSEAEIDTPVNEEALKRPTSLHMIGFQTVRRCAAPQPVLTPDNG